uniref:Reverse transcriptase N-terminal domain-containing protein n=1 Tax=Thuretia quercifolia TaxID=189650 RepID=A0A1Z1MJY7_9FLOR|nr:hypothetical protein [Thuretia quercifolia]ARW66400.1 hypothetical protein [Thuretia quercifolia]
MSYNYKLNINTNWNNLPWKYIFNRILIIQKKIYKSAKNCNFKDVLKLQQYLINSNEAKIVSIKYITEQLYFHYTYRSNAQYIIADKKKYKIFKFLFTYNKDILYELLIRMVEKYLIYLCLEPELKSKYPIFIYESNSNYFYYLSNLYKIELLKFNSKVNIKCKLIINTVKKIKRLKYISKYFGYKLYFSFYSSFINYQKIWSCYSKQKLFINKSNYLNIYYSFFFSIFTLDFYWYTFCTNKFSLLRRNFKTIYFKNTLYIKIERIKYYYEKLMIKIFKFSLSEKNRFKIFNLFYILYSCFEIVIYLSSKVIKYIYSIINSIIYYLFKKTFKMSLLYYKNTNILNSFFYKRKMEYFYISY